MFAGFVAILKFWKDTRNMAVQPFQQQAGVMIAIHVKPEVALSITALQMK